VSRDLQGEYLLDAAVVLNNITTLKKHCVTEDPCTHGKQRAENSTIINTLGSCYSMGRFLEWALSETTAIVVMSAKGARETKGRGRHSLSEEEHGRNVIKLVVQAGSDSILNIHLYAQGVLTRDPDGRNHCAEASRKKDDICRCLRDLGAPLDSDTAVRFLGSDGASFMLSPVMAVRCPRCCNISTTGTCVNSNCPCSVSGSAPSHSIFNSKPSPGYGRWVVET
jgi:hypothetical protein